MVIPRLEVLLLGTEIYNVEPVPPTLTLYQALLELVL